MRRASRNNAVRFKSLEKALEESPETYRHLNLIAFGFPCQDISQANPKGKGLKGKKSSIFFECMRIVNILKPAWLIIENVPRILSINGGRDFAIVLQTLSESGYGYAWRILDSQYFGVPQRRKRVFIIGCLGRQCPPEILFEQKSRCRDDKKKRKVWKGGICISARDGEKYDPTGETLILSTIQSTDKKLRKFGFGENLVAYMFNAEKRGVAGRIWEETHIAKINPKRKRKVARFSRGLDSHRGVVLGNAVTVNVAEWIGKRIMAFEANR